MSKELIKVHKVNDRIYGEMMDPEAMLDQVRRFLQDRDIMAGEDMFFFDDAMIDLHDEPHIHLGEILVDTGITVGKGSQTDVPQGGQTPMDIYDDLNTTRKADLLYDKCVLLNGMRVQQQADHCNLIKDTQPVFQQPTSLPRAAQPQLSEREEIFTSYSELTHQMDVQGVDKASVSLSTPFGGGSGKYSHEHGTHHADKTVHAYFLAKQFVPKVYISLDWKNLTPTVGLHAAIEAAVKLGGANGFEALLHVMETYGSYIATKFTIGGAICAQSVYDYHSREDAKSDSTSFGASVNASYDGFGGGGSYEHGKKTDTSSGQVDSKFSLEASVIGGDPSKALDLSDAKPWMDTLKDATLWRVIYQEELIPTLAAISSTDQNLYAQAQGLMKAQINDRVSINPHVHLGQYIEQMEEYIQIMF